jgi:hypothetical protein
MMAEQFSNLDKMCSLAEDENTNPYFSS